MSASATHFDISDPFDAAAFWHIVLECDRCGAFHEPVDDPGEVSVAASLPSYHATGQAAKQAGWYISDLHGPTAKWEILCPACAAAAERRLSERGVGTISSQMVRDLYLALTGRTE